MKRANHAVAQRLELATDDCLINAKDLARQLGIRVRTLYRWVREEKVPQPIQFPSRTLRWRMSSIQNFLATLTERTGKEA